MTDILKKHGFGTNPILHFTQVIEESSLEDLLTVMIEDLKIKIGSTMGKLAPNMEKDDMAIDIVNMLNNIELFQMHLEFTFAVLLSNTEEDVQNLKIKFNLIQESHKKVVTKEDLAQLPAKLALTTIHDKVMLELNKAFKKFFKEDKYGDIQLISNQHNIALLKVMNSRIEIINQHYPVVLTTPKDDIFNYPKTSPLWQDLNKSSINKTILTKEEFRTSFKMLHIANNLSHIIVKRHGEIKDLPFFKAVLSLAFDVLYYGSQQSKAEIQAFLHLIDPNNEEAIKVWNLIDHPLITKCMEMRLPRLGYDNLIYIPRLFTRISKELILKEYKEGTINKLQPLDPSLFKGPDLTNSRSEVLKELFIPNENKIPIRILSPDHLDIEGFEPSTVKGFIQKAKKTITGKIPKTAKATEEDGAIIIDLHGGGFVAMSSASMRCYLSRWCKNLKVVCFSVDYSLAPKNPYPAALDDIWQAYLWILNYSETILGIKNKKIIFAGDSSGGNLAMAITLRIIRAGLQIPHACLMIYPSLQLDTLYASPNSFQALDDPMLHISLLKLCIKAYVEPEFDCFSDPFVSPVVASSELLAKMPPVRIITGSEDPLQDDNWRVVAKLRKLNRDVKIIVHEHLTHGFIAYPELKNFHLYIEDSCQLVQELISIESTNNQ